jgi:carbonic anhydrase
MARHSPKPLEKDFRMFPEALKAGYRSFVDGRLTDEAKRYAKLAEGQSPEVLMISCCDSRVSPEVIFDTGPGELFVIRNVANIVPPCETGGDFHGTSAAIEFAVQGLEVKHIVVLGHASCGGIKAYANPAKPLSKGDFIGKWVSLVEPAAAKAGDTSVPDYQTRLEYAMVGQSLENLMTFPFVRERVESGRLALHGAHFGIARGELLLRDPETGEFKPAADQAGRGPTSVIGCSEA